MLNLRPQQTESFPEALDRILDKGIVIEARIRTSLAEVELIKISATIILASFKRAVGYGLDFPKGVNFETKAWRNLITKEECPQCQKLLEIKELNLGCPWCGFNTK